MIWQCVELFLFGVLAIGGHAVTGAKTADIDRAHT